MYEDLEILFDENGVGKLDLFFYSIYVREMCNFLVIVCMCVVLFVGGVVLSSIVL